MVGKPKETREGASARARFSLDASDEELRKSINDDLMNLTKHSVGTGMDKLSLIFRDNETDLILARLLRILADQNNILIRQNELMLRALRLR